MKSIDQDIYNEISNKLYSVVPLEAKKIIMNAELSQLGDFCKFKYNYYDKDDVKYWFLPDSRLDHDLRKILIKLRDFYISQNQPAWSGCEFIVDIELGKIKIEFKYDSNLDENSL